MAKPSPTPLWHARPTHQDPSRTFSYVRLMFMDVDFVLITSGLSVYSVV